MMKKIIFTTIIIFLSNYGIVAQSVKDSLTTKLKEISKNSEIAGFSVAVVSKDTILYKKGFGYADIENKIAFTDSTILNIGSITKTIIGFSLIKLVEEGKIKLDDPINKYLPFKVKNPYHPKCKITIRQLATHTSSLTDGKDDMLIEKSYLFNGKIDFKEEELPAGYYPYFQIYKTNKPLSMLDFLKNTYTTNGIWYNKSNFLKNKPGTTYSYTNIGATLLAFIVEKVSGKKFNNYTTQELFQPLNMKNTFWSLNNVPKDKLTSLYLSNGHKIPHYSLITYPDGGLYTNVSDFSLYLIEMIRGLNGEGKLLNEESYMEMMSNQLTKENFPDIDFKESKGLLWFVNKEGDNITMNGGDPGIVTYTLFTTKGNVGIIIFMNKNLYDNKSLEGDFNKIRGTLLQNIGKLMKDQKV